MLLIVLLGLIAKLALVSSDCDLGTVKVNDFDWTKIADSRPWYWLLYEPSGAEENLDCIVTTYADPVENSSAIITNAYDTRERRHIAFTGKVTDWNNTGYYELYDTDITWNGRYNILAIDYDRYFIVKYCSDILNKLFTAVAFRRQDPDEATGKDVDSDLIDNGIDITHLAVGTADHCQQI